MNHKGFTIKELTGTLMVIGVLFAIAIPQYYSLQKTSKLAQIRTLLKRLQSSLPTGDNTIQALDEEPSESPCKNCFNLVLKRGIKDPLWYKFSDLEYYYSLNGNHKYVNDYKEKGDYKITYDAQSGLIKVEQF